MCKQRGNAAPQLRWHQAYKYIPGIDHVWACACREASVAERERQQEVLEQQQAAAADELAGREARLVVAEAELAQQVATRCQE